MNTYGNSQRDIPARVLLIRYRAGDPSSEQLFLDQMPVPREAWDYDVADRILTWRGAYGGGRLYMTHDGRGATGNIGSLGELCSVKAGSQTIFDCDVALDIGATYRTVGEQVVGFDWDPTSSTWTEAHWEKNRLQLTYTYTPGGGMAPPAFTFQFHDNEADAAWVPDEGLFDYDLEMDAKNGETVWLLGFKSQLLPPDPDTGSKPDSVYPSWMQAVEDAAVTSINGVLEIDKSASPKGTLVGMQGVRPSAAASGYYRTSTDFAPFGVFDGRMTIGGRAVSHSKLLGSTLYWRDLAPEQQNTTGLPQRGSLDLLPNGSAAFSQTGIRATRLKATDALAALARHDHLSPELNARIASMHDTLNSPALNIDGLMTMNPFAQNGQGAWYDAVQAAVRQDLSDIMNSFIPSDMWGLLYPGVAQPTLSGELAIVANSPVKGVSNPKEFYRSLATAVMTQALARGSDPNCRNLNGPRAAEWLKTQIATSPVYNVHGQKLFNYEWQQKFRNFADYLKDQDNNAASYETQIDDQVKLSIADIGKNVSTASDDQNMKADLEHQVQNAGEFAKHNKVYWAFYYYTYNTSPAFLTNIAVHMAMTTGSADGTFLSRLLQQNSAVLTALDPSGFFASQYVNTINTFVATNILPSMFDFQGDASNFDILKLYLQQFVQDNLKNQDGEIANVAEQLNSILESEDADELLHNSIKALQDLARTVQDALALPYIAEKFLNWFQTNYPRLKTASTWFCSLIMGGITGLGVFNLVSEFKNWDKLSDAEKAQLVIDASQFGLQIVAAVIKRSVSIGALFRAEGLTGMQRAAAIWKVLGTGGEGQAVLENALMKVGNSTARWLADTEGTVGKLVTSGPAATAAVLLTGTESAIEDASLVKTFLGRSLDEFTATRLGPVLILAGVGLSLYYIAEGESELSLANDIVNVVGGAFTVFAVWGEWAIAEGGVAEDGVLSTIIEVAGPIGILCALAGLGIMIAQMLQKPPDPVQEFVDNYARPAGFGVSGQASSIEYTAPYNNPDQNDLLMIGFSLSAGQQYLLSDSSGSISLGKAANLPDCVWIAQTDGLGLSKIVTMVQTDASKPAIAVFLSLMSDNSISFQPALPPPPPSGPVSRTRESSPTVVTQTWLSKPVGTATLTSTGGFLASLQLKFQAVHPDSNGNYLPSQASEWVQLQSLKDVVGITLDETKATTFTLKMSGMAPNFMRMVDMHFVLNSRPSECRHMDLPLACFPACRLSST